MAKNKKKKKTPKISQEEQLEILQKEAEAKWQSEQVTLTEKTNLELKEYNLRRVVLVETVKFFRRLEKAAAEANRNLSKDQEWNQYLSCEKLPNATSAAELRDFLYRWSYELEENSKNFTSWTLDVDERSPLTQDETAPLTTRKVLKEKNKDVGSLYLPGIRNALRILRLIDDSAQKSLPPKEVSLVRDEIRAKITQVLDMMTMRIAGNIERDMTPLDAISADYSFSSDVIQFYLWSFRPVPLPLEYNYFVRTLTMSTLQSKFFKPPSLDFKSCSMRGLWTAFDHLSDLDPTFRCSYLEPIPDLMASLELEWAERGRLKSQKLQDMRSRREKFEADQKQKELELLEAAKAGGSKKGSAKGKGKKKGGKRKKSREKSGGDTVEAPPPQVTEGTLVDVEEQFVKQEEEMYEQKMGQIGPGSLDVGEGYINLRKYRLTGGIFSVNRFEELPQTSEMRGDFIYTSLPVDLKLTEKQFRSDSDAELVKIEIKLPSYCFWWHEPIVCTWEVWEESDEFLGLNTELQEFHLHYDEIMEEKSKKLFGAPKLPKHSVKPTIIPDFSLNDIPIGIKLHFLILDHILPRLPQNFKFHAELHQLFQTIEKQFLREQRLKMEQSLNELLYPRFLMLKASNDSDQQDPLYVPSFSDIPEGQESTVSLGESLISMRIDTPVQSMLQELAMAQTEPCYLFPPGHQIPLLLITEANSLKQPDIDLEEMIQELHESVMSDDDFSAESVFKLFSTFLKLLDRLRAKEQPEFPEVEEPEEEPEPIEPEEPSVKPRTVSRDSTHKHDDEKRRQKRVSSFMVMNKQKQSTAAADKRRRRRKKSLVRLLSMPSDLSTDDERETKGEPESAELKVPPHVPGRWTTKLVRKQEFDPRENVVTVWVERLGTFGFAMEKYHNLPFKGWDMRRTGKISDLTTTLTLDCIGLTVSISITKSGYRIDFNDAPQSSIVPPAAEELTLDELELYLNRINLSIFAESDAPFYVHNMTTPKHETMEMHNLKCLSAFCLTHNFAQCFWNRYTRYREALFRCRQVIEGCPEQDFVTILVDPLKALNVTVEEACSSDLDQVVLEYHPEPENQAFNPDVYNLLKDSLVEPSRKLLLKTPPLLQWNVAQLLLRLRLFSFS